MLGEMERLATGREESIFASDLAARASEIRSRLEDSRIAVIGAAGSIGAAVVKQILRHSPRALALFDLSENNLVELVRDLRSSVGVAVPGDFTAMPIGLGSIEFDQYFRESTPFQYVFNLSAMKHVRSEKDVYCLIRMIDTNVIFPHEFLTRLPYPLTRFFSVSSDKATQPANLMGASKMVMEEVLKHHSNRHSVSSARFANVAFSDGSLPYGFLRRMEKGQPISAPRDVKRYFISHQEAGELCLLAGILGENRDVLFPKPQILREAMSFADIAVGLLELRGYKAVLCGSEAEAKAEAGRLIPSRQWPCYFFNSDTTGEKMLEEFYTPEDTVDLTRFTAAGVIPGTHPRGEAPSLQAFLDFAVRLKTVQGISKAEVVEAFKKLVPGLSHVETGLNLDQRM